MALGERLKTAARRVRPVAPRTEFHSDHYLRHNQRRLEHLATLDLPIANRSVLEVGAGIGDHTTFFLDRGCTVTITEGRDANLEVLRRRFSGKRVKRLDLDAPDESFTEVFDVVYCYGLLYHLARPAPAIAYLAARCSDLLLLETCVSPGLEVEQYPEEEAAHRPSQALSGTGCRPTRPWVLNELRRHFDHAYVTRTQPWHEEFPTDWTASPSGRLTRAVFVAARRPLVSDLLSTEPLQQQER